MMLAYTQVSGPVWADASQTTIRATVTFEHLARPVSFLASPLDMEPHGRELFTDLKSGKYGPVAPYVPPAPKAVEPPALPNDVPSPALVSAVTRAVVAAMSMQNKPTE